MKSYDEIAERILEKYNSRIAEKKRRRGIIMRTAGSVSGVCAAVIVGVAVWHNTTLRDASRVLYQPQKSNVIVVEGTTADSGNADVSEEAAAAPQTVPVQAAEMTAAQTTVTAADAPAVPTMTAAVNDAPLQTAPAKTAPISTAVTAQTAPAAPQTTATAAQITQTITAAKPQQTTAKAGNNVTVTTVLTTPYAHQTTTEAALIVTTTAEDWIIDPPTTTAVKWEDLPIYEQYATFQQRKRSEDSTKDIYTYYTKGITISEDYVWTREKNFADVINETMVSIEIDSEGNEIVHTTTAEIFSIMYREEPDVVAVKFEGTDVYYIYYNQYYDGSFDDQL